MARSSTVSNKLNKVVNFILFQAIWLACVLGVTNSNMFSAWILFAALIYWQLSPKNQNPKDFVFVLVLLPMGLLLDSLWIFFALIEYKEPLPISKIAPYWIGILWVTFALSLNHSMKWLFKRPKIAVLFGGICGPLSYLGAERLGAINIIQHDIAIPMLSLSWFFVMLVILFINNKARYWVMTKSKKTNHV